MRGLKRVLFVVAVVLLLPSISAAQGTLTGTVRDGSGAVLGEWTKHRDLSHAGRVGAAAWIGFLLGSAVKIALAFSMVAIFLAAMFVF